MKTNPKARKPNIPGRRKKSLALWSALYCNNKREIKIRDALITDTIKKLIQSDARRGIFPVYNVTLTDWSECISQLINANKAMQSANGTGRNKYQKCVAVITKCLTLHYWRMSSGKYNNCTKSQHGLVDFACCFFAQQSWMVTFDGK